MRVAVSCARGGVLRGGGDRPGGLPGPPFHAGLFVICFLRATSHACVDQARRCEKRDEALRGALPPPLLPRPCRVEEDGGARRARRRPRRRHPQPFPPRAAPPILKLRRGALPSISMRMPPRPRAIRLAVIKGGGRAARQACQALMAEAVAEDKSPARRAPPAAIVRCRVRGGHAVSWSSRPRPGAGLSGRVPNSAVAGRRRRRARRAAARGSTARWAA